MSQPIKTYRAGGISAKIWENQTIKPDGAVSVYHTISIERSYQDKEGNWKSTNSLRINDLPKAQLVLKKAYEALVLREVEPAHSLAGGIPIPA